MTAASGNWALILILWESCTGRLLPPISLFANWEWDVFVLDHVPNLSLHCQYKEHYPVKEKYWPEYWHIKYREKCHHKSNTDSLCQGIPELELGQTSDEGFEFVVTLGGQCGAFGFRICLWGQEANQQIQKINPQPISHNVVTLHIIHSQAVEDGHEQCGDPSGHGMGCGFVQEVLKPARYIVLPLHRRRSRRRIIVIGGFHR